jgi:chemotaxis protein MotB
MEAAGLPCAPKGDPMKQLQRFLSQPAPAPVSAVTVLLACLVLAAGGGCVTSGKFDAKVAELDASVGREERLKAEIAQLKSEIARLQQSLDDSRKKNDNAVAAIAEMRERLTKLGQNVDQLSTEKGQLAAGLQDAEQRLEELRRQKAAAEARAATFRGLVEKLRSMIDAGQLKVSIRNGRMLIVLPNDVLFDSGRTDLRQAGKLTLQKVAQVLAGIADRRFLVAGHTDNIPIRNAKFASNWELSTARSVEVTKLLIGAGMKPETLGAAGYAEFDPAGPNETVEGRALNRRIEIILEPNLSDLPSLEGLNAEPKK